MPDTSKPCPHSHVRRQDAKGWIKLRWKHNAKVKVECVMQNEWIDGLTINHSFVPLTEQKQMWALEAKEMESSSKIDLKDVLWWMFIIDAYRFGALVIAKILKKGCIFLVIRRRLSWIAWKHDWKRCGSFQLEKHTLSKWVYWKYEIWNIDMEPIKPNSLRKQMGHNLP